MKNRILAVLCLVLILVPLLVLPIAADGENTDGIVEATKEEYDAWVAEDQAYLENEDIGVTEEGSDTYDGFTGYTVGIDSAMSDGDMSLDDYISVHRLNENGYAAKTLRAFQDYYGKIPDVYYDNYARTSGLRIDYYGFTLNTDLGYQSMNNGADVFYGYGFWGVTIYNTKHDTFAEFLGGGDVSFYTEGSTMVLRFTMDQSDSALNYTDSSVNYCELVYEYESTYTDNNYYEDGTLNTYNPKTSYKRYYLKHVKVENPNGVHDFANKNYKVAVNVAFGEVEPVAPNYLLNLMLSPGLRPTNKDWPFSGGWRNWYFPRQYVEAYELAWDAGNTVGYGSGYDSGYLDGDALGYDRGYYHGQNDGYNSGHKDGWAEGYTDGESSAVEGFDDFGGLVVGIFEAPGRLIDSMLDFDIFGINIASFVKVLLTLAITAVIVFFVFKLTRG